MQRSLLTFAVIGAALSGGFGAVAGAGLRVDAPQPTGAATPETPFTPASFEGAPPYPAWAPPPLYGRDRSDEDLVSAWLPGLESEPAQAAEPSPVRFEPPDDLPPPYEVRSVSYDRGPPPEFRAHRGRLRDDRRFQMDPPQPFRAHAPGPVHRPPPPPPPMFEPPPPPRAWIDRDGRVYVEGPPPPPEPMRPPPPRHGPPPPPPIQAGPPLDRPALFF